MHAPASFARTAPSRAALRLLASLAALPALPALLPAQIVTWDGGGADSLWTTAQNWDGDLPPASDPALRLIFTGPPTVEPDTSTTTIANVSFQLLGLAFATGSGAFTLTGSPLYLTGDPDDLGSSYILNDSDVAQTIDNALLMGAHVRLRADAGDLVLNGDVHLTGPLHLSGGSARSITFTGAFSYSHTDAPVLVLADQIDADPGDDNTFTVRFVSRIDIVDTDPSDAPDSGAPDFRIGANVTFAGDLAATGPAPTLLEPGLRTVIEIAGTLTNATTDSIGSTFDNVLVRVASGGRIDGNTDSADDETDGFVFHGDSVLRLDTADAVGPDAYFEFHDNSSISSTTPGAIADGWFLHSGPDPLSADPVRTVTLPGPGVIVGGFHEFEGKTFVDLDQTGMITGYTDLALYDTALLVLSAPHALGGDAPTDPDTDETDIVLELNGDSTVRIDSDNALRRTSLFVADASRFILNGHSASLDNLAALGGQIVNNSASPATLAINPCGCGPTFVFGDVFADQTSDHAGTSAPLALDIDGLGDVILFGIQRHTGPTTVTGVNLVVIGDLDTDDVVRGIVSSPLALKGGAILAGIGPVNTVAADDGSTISPGSDYTGPVARLETASVTLTGDVAFDVDLLDADDSNDLDGFDWDRLAVKGTFSFSATLGDTFTIYLYSLDSQFDTFLAEDFDPAQSYAFDLVHATGGILNFDPANIFIDTTGFENPHGGDWSVSLSPDTNTLSLAYTAPIPEPASAATLAALAALGLAARRRRGQAR